MSFKPGDLCLVVKGVDAGKAVTILERLKAGSVIPEHGANNHFALKFGPVWRVDRELQWFAEQRPVDPLPYCPESYLRKLDPDEQTEDVFILENVLHSVDHLQDTIRPARV